MEEYTEGVHVPLTEEMLHSEATETEEALMTHKEGIKMELMSSDIEAGRRDELNAELVLIEAKLQNLHHE